MKKAYSEKQKIGKCLQFGLKITEIGENLETDKKLLFLKISKKLRNF